MSLWRHSSVCDISAESSAKSISLIRTCRALGFARRWIGLNSLHQTLSEDEPKVYESSMKKNIPNKVCARMQPCFTSLRIGNDFEDDPSYCTVSNRRQQLRGTCNLLEEYKESSLLTRSKAFVRSTKTMYSVDHNKGKDFPTPLSREIPL